MFRPVPAAPTPATLAQRAEGILRAMGATSASIEVAIVSAGVPAHALGWTYEGAAAGRITLTNDLVSLLEPRELDFVLAHECAHIYHNHLWTSALSTIPNAMLKEFGKTNGVALGAYFALELAKVLAILQGQLPYAQEISIKQETDADACAIAYTGGLTAARSALWKLAGENPDHPSHVWELLGHKHATMSMGQRLEWLDHNAMLLKADGRAFW